MAFFGFKSSKEVEEEKRKLRAEEEAKRKVAEQVAVQKAMQEQAASLDNQAKGGHTRFRIPYFDAFDPRIETGVPVAVGVTVVYAIEDMNTFLQINAMQSFNESVFNDKLKSGVTKFVKSVVSNAPSDGNFPLVQIERRIESVSDIVQAKVIPQVERTFAIKVRTLDVTDIIIDKASHAYRELREQTSDMDAEKRMMQHQMNMSNMQLQHETEQSNFKLKNSLDQDLLKTQSALNIDSLKRQQEMSLSGQEEMQKMQLEMQRLQSVDTLKMQMDNQRETMRIQREEMQRAARLQSESNFLNAHQANLNANVANTKSVFGQQTAQTQGLGLGTSQTSGNTMPPIPGSIPQVQYSIALNGQQYGPYDWTQLQQLVQQGQLTQQTYVWTQGMSNWDFAGNIEELQPLFLPSAPQMPPVPGM